MAKSLLHNGQRPMTSLLHNSIEMFQPLRKKKQFVPLSLEESPAKCGFYLSIPSGGEEGEDAGDDEK